MRARRAVTHCASWRRHPSSQCPIGVPYELLKFAPKKVRGDGIPTEQSGGPIVEMLQSAGQQLRAAENRINQLETQIEHVQDRTLAKKRSRRSSLGRRSIRQRWRPGCDLGRGSP